jgi:hypothetical protein
MTALQNELSIECRELDRSTPELSGAELDAVNGGKSFIQMSTILSDASRKYDEMLQSIVRNTR